LKNLKSLIFDPRWGREIVYPIFLYKHIIPLGWENITEYWVNRF